MPQTFRKRLLPHFRALLMATIIYVAEAAGVSITTISHIIGGTRTVSEAPTKRVLNAIQALADRPSILVHAQHSYRPAFGVQATQRLKEESHGCT
jgi:DNA-binding LacI/PurR family transcriptional regulator